MKHEKTYVTDNVVVNTCGLWDAPVCIQILACPLPICANSGNCFIFLSSAPRV